MAAKRAETLRHTPSPPPPPSPPPLPPPSQPLPRLRRIRPPFLSRPMYQASSDVYAPSSPVYNTNTKCETAADQELAECGLCHVGGANSKDTTRQRESDCSLQFSSLLSSMPDFETEDETDAWIRCLSKREADGCMERLSQRDTQ